MAERENLYNTVEEALVAYDQYLANGGSWRDDEAGEIFNEAFKLGAHYLDISRLDIKHSSPVERQHRFESEFFSLPHFSGKPTIDNLEEHLKELKGYLDRLRIIRDEFGLEG